MGDWSPVGGNGGSIPPAVYTGTYFDLAMDGVTDDAPAINAIPANAGRVFVGGKILCKSPITLQNGVALVGRGVLPQNAPYPLNSYLKFDPTQTWSTTTPLITLGTGNVSTGSGIGLEGLWLDFANIPMTVAAIYSAVIQQNCYLRDIFGVNWTGGGLKLDGSGTPHPNNYDLNNVYLVASAAQSGTVYGIDIVGSKPLGMRAITVQGPYSSAGGTAPITAAVRINGISSDLGGFAIDGIHMEVCSVGILIGDTGAVGGLSVDGIVGPSLDGYGGNVDMVKIASPPLGKNISCEFGPFTPSVYAAGSNYVNDVQNGATVPIPSTVTGVRKYVLDGQGFGQQVPNQARAKAKLLYYASGSFVPGINQAILEEFELTSPMTIAHLTINFAAVDNTKSFDLGIYDSTYTRLWHLGTTAVPGSAGDYTAAPAITLPPGVYFVAFVTNDGTTTKLTGAGAGVPGAGATLHSAIQYQGSVTGATLPTPLAPTNGLAVAYNVSLSAG